MSDAHAAEDPVGSLGEEAVKLLSAVSAWAQDHAAGSADEPAEPGPAQGSTCSCGGTSTCAWCPVCQAATFARAASPELKEQLVTAGLALTSAARLLLEQLAAPPTAPGPDGRSDDVEHIDLSDEGEAQSWD
jgi:hypothetical protein